ncbi:MAG: hypothetical protein A2X49_05660 [Lentisphaerae bacterium GWF2_52_8]|nr:MAG: hypothetical protein A2X49_05660 [Lentisphaerae bacterium GWF2_52_8]
MRSLGRKTGEELLGSGSWLTLKKLAYLDHAGHGRHWECVERKRCNGAVAMLAVLQPSRRLVIVRQYRPPLDAFVLEFPAGLIDCGENPEQTAVRELWEETGYRGVVKKILPPVCNSPGLTGEAVHLAIIDVDERLPENDNPHPHCEASEDISVQLVELGQVPQFLAEAQRNGDMLDAKLASFALAMRFESGLDD